MITKTDLNKLQQIINELNDWDALEFCFSTENEETDCFIPYMMNDALEYYVNLKNCHISGEFCSECQHDTTGELITESDKTGLIVRQGEGRVCTIWFHDFQIVRQCYQYHRIGHFWVQNQEQWRQLVYIIGTIYDKQNYIGDEVCNKKEQDLLPLMNFPPLLMWFPLNEVPWEKYPCTKEGCECMYRLAMEAGDKLFAFLVKLYEKVHFPKFTLFLGKLLTKKRRIPLYNLLYRKICSASETYPTRDYGQANNNRITALRYEAEFKLHRKGFTGNYPFFQKDSIQVFAAEEHPFTVMESDDFYFRIQYMVSRSSCPDSGFNSGFFHSRNNESMITKDLSDID